MSMFGRTFEDDKRRLWQATGRRVHRWEGGADYAVYSDGRVIEEINGHFRNIAHRQFANTIRQAWSYLLGAPIAAPKKSAPRPLQRRHFMDPRGDVWVRGFHEGEVICRLSDEDVVICRLEGRQVRVGYQLEVTFKPLKEARNAVAAIKKLWPERTSK